MADEFLGLGQFGDTADERILRLIERVREIEGELQEYRSAFRQITYRPPDRPREGMIRFADGTSWNPSGDGTVGYHQYKGGTWTKM